MMEQLKRLSIITMAILGITIGLVLAICVGSLSFPGSGLLGAFAGLFAFGLIIRLWAI